MKKALLFTVCIIGFSLILNAQTTIYDIQYTTTPGSEGTYPSPMEGEEVGVIGIVTANGYSGEKFFISDSEGGPWHGIYVFEYTANPEVGDEVEVTGTVTEYYGFTEIGYATVAVLSSGNPVPEPVEITTYELADEEAYEGVLVKISNVTVTQTTDGYGQWYVDDGSGECQIDNGIYSYSNPQIGDEFASITGVVDYSYSEYGLNPRSEDDFILGELSAPQNLQIQIIENQVHLSWDAAEDATSYKIYSSDNPYSDFTEVHSTSDTNWTTSASGNRKFYYVTANN